MSKIVADADGLIKMGKLGALPALLGAAGVLVPQTVWEEAVEEGKRRMYEDAQILERSLMEGAPRWSATSDPGPRRSRWSDRERTLVRGSGRPWRCLREGCRCDPHGRWCLSQAARGGEATVFIAGSCGSDRRAR